MRKLKINWDDLGSPTTPGMYPVGRHTYQVRVQQHEIEAVAERGGNPVVDIVEVEPNVFIIGQFESAP